MNKEDIYEKICDWQINAGESFIDYWGWKITIPSFMFWCLGKGILTKGQFNAWESDYTSKDHMQRHSAEEPNYFIGGSDEELPYALCDLDNWEVGMRILSEFISESTVYQKRLNNFLENWGKDVGDDEDDE